MTSSIIEIRGLTKRYDGVTALDDLTLAVEEGALGLPPLGGPARTPLN